MTVTAGWLIAALLILGCEMLAGSVYLLAVFLGCVTAAAAAGFGADLTLQLLLAGLIALLGVGGAYKFRRRLRTLYAKRGTPADNPDQGQTVRVTAVDADGGAVVRYRGARWPARAVGARLSPGTWVIARVDGPQLLLDRKID